MPRANSLALEVTTASMTTMPFVPNSTAGAGPFGSFAGECGGEKVHAERQKSRIGAPRRHTSTALFEASDRPLPDHRAIARACSPPTQIVLNLRSRGRAQRPVR